MNMGNVGYYSTVRSMSSTSLHYGAEDNSSKSIDISSHKGAYNNFMLFLIN